MTPIIKDQINQFYLDHGIHPTNFRCPNQNFCRRFAHSQGMIEAKMSLVGSSYGEKYPKIVVVSLDPPGQGNKFFTSEQRTTEYIIKFTESENYTMNRPNPHWAMTQILVKDILNLFGRKAIFGSAVIIDSYAGRPIENVTRFFAHVNVAKCSMNNPGKRQAAREVHDKCSRAYLFEELKILQPDILISQGKTTNEIMGEYLIGKPIIENDLPTSHTLNLDGLSPLWLAMRHPTQQLDKIRRDWPTYELAILKWARK